MKYTAEIDWGAGGECRLSAASLEEVWELACQWARDGDWEDCSRVAETEDDRAHGVVVRNDVWAHVSVSGDDDEWREGEVLVWDTAEHDPPCPGGHEHEWESTVEVDGGCSQNPGWMSGSGRAWSASAHCAVCGMRRREYGDPDAAEQWRRTVVQWREWEWEDMTMRLEAHDLHGTGAVPCEVYPMPGAGWDSVTTVPCPVDGCGQTVVWWEAGYVPGYRVCTARIGDKDEYDIRSIRHRFVGAPGAPGRLIRDQEGEG